MSMCAEESNFFEPMESRQMYSVSAISIGGVLTVIGDNTPNSIVVSRDNAGKLLVNGGAVKVLGVTPTVANTSIINIAGLGGNDNLVIDESNGALPRANLLGGADNDTLI